MIGVGILAVSLFATSFVFGFLFLLAFAAFRIFSQRACRAVLCRLSVGRSGSQLNRMSGGLDSRHHNPLTQAPTWLGRS